MTDNGWKLPEIVDLKKKKLLEFLEMAEYG